MNLLKNHGVREGDAKNSPTVLTLLTAEQLRFVVFEAVREAISTVRVDGREEQYFNTAGAAKYLKTTVAALHMQIQRGNLKPDSRGGPGRLKGHRFTRATLDAYIENDQ